MRVSIEQRETKVGLVFKKPAVDVVTTVQFSEEELAIIKERKLQRKIVLERPTPFGQKHNPNLEDIWHLTVSKLMHGPDTFTVENPFEAKKMEADLKEALTTLKEYIAHNASVEAAATTFEL